MSARLITWFRVTATPLRVSTPLLASWVTLMAVKLPESLSRSFTGPVPSLPNRPSAVRVNGLSSAVVKVSFTATGASLVAVTLMVSWPLAPSLSASLML